MHSMRSRASKVSFDLPSTIRMLRRHWIVADMDGTLLSTPSKAHGKYLPLDTSPCYEPLQWFLRHGANVVVVSTAGQRMWRQMFEPLRCALFPTAGPVQADEHPPGQLYVCGFSGAALFVSDKTTESLVEVGTYRDVACADGQPTVIPSSLLSQVEPLLATALRKSLRLCRSDPAYLMALSRKYHEPIRGILSAVGDSDLDASPLLSLEQLKTYGAFLKETNDALLDVQCIPHIADRMFETVAAQITVLAVPMARASEVFSTDIVAELNSLGLSVKFQPNSVVVTRRGLDKGVCIRYLVEHEGMDLSRSIALGDVPQSIDKPLTEFPPMTFVSVAPDSSHDDPHWLSVGHEEVGAGRFLASLVSVLELEAPSNSINSNGSSMESRFTIPLLRSALELTRQTASSL